MLCYSYIVTYIYIYMCVCVYKDQSTPCINIISY